MKCIMKTDNKSIGWGVVGLDWVAADFVVPPMAKNPGSRLVACLGSSPDKSREFAQRFGFEHACNDLDALLRTPGVDAVYIALPNAMHHAAVMAAARAKKHVLCEKPFAMTVAHAREMASACRDASVILRIAHQIRLEEAIVRAREIVQSGRLGRLSSISLERSSANPARKTWRLDIAQSGVIFDVGVHLLDLIQWVTGQRYAEVSAFTNPDRRQGKSDDTITILGRMADGCHAIARATREVASAENNLIIEGSDATLITSALRFAKEHVVRVRDAKGVTTEERFAPSPAYDLEIRAFEGEIRGERSHLPDDDDGIHNVLVTQAVLRSIEQRRIVEVAAP